MKRRALWTLGGLVVAGAALALGVWRWSGGLGEQVRAPAASALTAAADPGRVMEPDAAADVASVGPPASDHAVTFQAENIPYDGRFIFLRVRYGASGRGMFRGRGREPPWQHDYPRAEQNLAQILTELTFLEPYTGGGNILQLDDPELYQYPIAYVSEPGFWDPGEDEVRALRDYVYKGGFLIFDDFGGGRDFSNFEFQLNRVLPEGRLVELDLTNPIFNSFFQIEDVNYHSYRGNGRPPTYYGIYEDNDPAKRLLLIGNYDNDIGEFWEYSGSGWYPIDLTNEAYKLGVNYIIYAMTH